MLYRPMKQYIAAGRDILKQHERPKGCGWRLWRNMPHRCLLDAREFLWQTMRTHWPQIPPAALRDLLVYAIVCCERDERDDQ